jgi:hypothetical protein
MRIGILQKNLQIWILGAKNTDNKYEETGSGIVRYCCFNLTTLAKATGSLLENILVPVPLQMC